MKKKKVKKIVKKNSSMNNSDIDKLFESRTGGQNALRGYSYQFLYSCYLILSSNSNETVFTLEGIEDIDCVKSCDKDNAITHIQLKYSIVRQNAGFMDSVLKNFLEAYLIDKKRYFKLVYDFSLANGNLSKLFFGKLDESSEKFWITKVDEIRKNSPLWNWDDFDFNDFITRLSFENIKKDSLEQYIENSLIKHFEITTDNITLYANGIKLLCFDKMVNRGKIKYEDVLNCVEKTRFDISRGTQNPAHSWIQKLIFSKSDGYSSDYYEGKKATPSDIANSIPVERPLSEKEIIDSIKNNTVTVIKTSSGQGKTTLALRTILALQDEYTPYQIIKCNNDSELGHMVDYFHMRTRIGEKPLILFDNLDAHISEWNLLAQLLQSKVKFHYKILVTSRENDWYNYGGDIANLHKIKIIKPVLNEKEAEEIFCSLKKAGKLNSNITNWKNAWNKISDRQLLIEYVYLLTHGEMIADRISAQMKEIGNSSDGSLKFEILRKVCFADICGIKLETRSLIDDLTAKRNSDIGEILKSLTDEFLVHISTEGNYIEGLHPVRSNHIIKRLHEYFSLNQTALSIAKIASKADISVLFSHYPEFDFDKEIFYSDLVDMWLSEKDLSRFVQAIRGTFSGSVMQYFRDNKEVFDDAFNHGGLTLVTMDLCPFTLNQEYDQDSSFSLDKLLETLSENSNIQYLIDLRDSLPKFRTSHTDIYCLCFALFKKLKQIEFATITDLDSYSSIAEWLYNIDSTMDLSYLISLTALWDKVNNYSLKTISTLMYSSYCGNNDEYMNFVKDNQQKIIHYLTHKTCSQKIQVIDNKIIKVEYILKASDVAQGNDESVSRLTSICRTLPIFEGYYSDSISPKIEFLENYQIPDDAHKEMPKRNLLITFHQEFNNLWLNTIESNYEFETVDSWIVYWLDVRKCACDLLKASCTCMYKSLSNKKFGDSAISFDNLHQRFNKMTTVYYSYPRAHRPFEKKSEIPDLFNSVKQKYFNGIQNFGNQMVRFLNCDEDTQRLAILNLKTSLSALPKLQDFFNGLALDKEKNNQHEELCSIEENIIMETYMCCEYYLVHSPSQFFNKFQVKNWFMSLNNSELNKINCKMLELTDLYDIVLPSKVYLEKTFYCYPVILKHFNLTDDKEMIDHFLVNAVSFAESIYDYIDLILTNDEGKLLNNALRIPKKAFEFVHRSLNLNKEEAFDKYALPYPIEVSQKMLDCFEENYNIQEEKPFQNWHSCLVDIGEELWVYSKNRELLIEKEDMQYLSDNLNAIKIRIQKIIEDNKSILEKDNLLVINKLCKGVFDGESFDDKKYNELITNITLGKQ